MKTPSACPHGQADTRQKHLPLDELVNEKLSSPARRYLEAVGPIPFEHTAKALLLPRLLQLLRHGGALISSAHHDRGHHFDRGAECSGDNAGDGAGVNELEALCGRGGESG
mmetsp:Transcript_31013/g.65854  ORF Transcript_31013/g.65854 Transcript_31013/m.65854 type:complete len:111 (+) Transcript_31013:949-1281(+)